MKTLLKILFGLAVAGAGIVGLVFWMTAGLPSAADAFFSKIAAKDFDGALALTTPDFRANTDRAGLEAFANSNGLTGYQSASWSSRSINNDSGTLEGTLNVQGGTIPVTVNLVKSNGEWRVQGITKAGAGASTVPSTAPSAPQATPDTPPQAEPAASEEPVGDADANAESDSSESEE